MQTIRNFALATLTAAAFAQTVDQIAVSTSVRANGASAAIELKLTNNSPRIVTAWAWTVEGRYAGGSSKSHSGTVDAVTELFSDAAFRPKTSRTFEESLPLGASGDLPTTTSAKLTMVVFDDNMALGDATSIRRLAAERKGQAKSYADELSKIEEALKTASPEKVLGTAPNSNLGMSRQILGLLKINAGAEAINAALKAFHGQQALIATHSDLQPK